MIRMISDKSDKGQANNNITWHFSLILVGMKEAGSYRLTSDDDRLV